MPISPRKGFMPSAARTPRAITSGGSGLTFPGAHDICFSLYALMSLRLNRSRSSPTTTVNSQGCRLIADGACTALLSTSSIFSLGTGSGLNARMLLLSLMACMTSMPWLLLHISTFFVNGLYIDFTVKSLAQGLLQAIKVFRLLNLYHQFPVIEHSQPPVLFDDI